MGQNNRSLPLIRVTHSQNRTPTGRRTATPARHAARYFAFGRDREAELAGRQRGEWMGPEGRVHDHENVLAWAALQAMAHRYTFQALLSVPEGRLAPADYARALEAAGDEQLGSWRLMAHDDTDYSHAHVLFFGDRRLPKEEYLAWRERVQEELALMESARLDGAALEADMEVAAGAGMGLE